jgi:5-formyltetrahydrofolate cyclo-ligase
MESRACISTEKQKLRQEILSRRNEMPPGTRSTASESIAGKVLGAPEVTAAGTVFCFISADHEVHTHGILDQLLQRGKTLLVPKILRGEPMRAVAFTGWEDLTPGTLGILAPTESTPFAGYVDLVITPGLSFTPDGHRLGYGKGYYDRWFATHEHGTRIGIAFQCQVQDTLPTNHLDVRVHQVVTEKRRYDPRASR